MTSPGFTLPQEIVDAGRREREQRSLSTITSDLDRKFKDGMAALTSVAGGVTEHLSPFAQALAEGGLKVPTLDDLTPQWIRDRQSETSTYTPGGSQPSGGAPTASGAAMPGGQTAPASRTPSAMPTGAPSGDLQTKARQYAQKYNLDPERFVAQIQAESQFDPAAVNPNSGAAGLGQFMPATAQGLGIDPMDPDQSLDGAARYMRQMLDANGGDYRRALAAYNWGPGNVASWDGSDESLPAETRGYISNILNTPASPSSVSPTRQTTLETPSSTAGIAPQQPVDRGTDLYPRQDLLDDPDKWAVCGPLGVMAFGAMTGHPVTYEQAKQAATAAGWTPAGMKGPQSQVAALRSIGVATKTGPIDLEMITREVRNGNPVGLSSPGESGHYFTVQGVDDQGRLDLGNSALSLRASGGTKRYWTLDELRGIGALGAVDTAIYMDNPASPTPSVAADPRVSLNAGSTVGTSPSSSGTSAGGVPPLPADASPLDAARSGQDGSFSAMSLSMKGMPADEPLGGASSDEGAIDAAQALPPRPTPAQNRIEMNPDESEYRVPGIEHWRYAQKAPLDPNPEADQPTGDTTWNGSGASSGGSPNQPTTPVADGTGQSIPMSADSAAVDARPQGTTTAVTSSDPTYDPRTADEDPGARELPPGPQPISVTAGAETAPTSQPLYGPSEAEAGPPHLPLYDEVGKLVGYVKSGAQAVGNAVGAVADTAKDYGLEPAGGMPRMLDRIHEINDQAAREQGRTDFRAKFDAAEDPTWRAANPELAAEYDDLMSQSTLTVGGTVGDAAAFRSAAQKGIKAAAQRATGAADEVAPTAARVERQAGLTGMGDELVPPMERGGPPVKPDIPAVSDAPNRPPRPGDNPNLFREPVLPGMEGLEPPRVRESLPDVSDAPNAAPTVASAMGNARPSQVREPMLPGMEPPPTRPLSEVTREILGDAADTVTDVPAVRAEGGQTYIPNMQAQRGLSERIADIVSPWANRVNIVRFAGMLSDTAGHAMNAAGGVIGAGVDLATTPITAALDASRVGVARGARAVGAERIASRIGTEREAFFSEVPARLRGMRAGASVGMENAAEIMAHGTEPTTRIAGGTLEAASAIPNEATKLDHPVKGFGTDIPGIAPAGSKAAAVTDFAFEAPLRALAAADAVFRGTAKGGHLLAEATAAATKANGGKPPTPAQIREAMKNPDLLDRVNYLSARSVLQEDRMVTDWYKKGMGHKFNNPTGQLAADTIRAGVALEIPFVKTPYNVVAQGVGMSPSGLLGLVQDIAEGRSAREMEQRVARVALGTAIMVPAMSSYAAGGLTGPYPTDPKERSTLPPGWTPWAKKIPLPGGGTYYLPLSVFGPLALPPVMAILAAEAYKKNGLSPAWAGEVAKGMAQYAAQNTFFQGVTNIAKSLDERAGDKNMERNAEQIAAQFSPHIIGGGALGREIQRIMGMPLRDPQGAMEALLATHPATAHLVEPAQDIIGRPRKSGGLGVANAVIRGNVEQDAAVIRAYRTAKEGLPTPPKQIPDPDTGQSRTLTPSKQKLWQRTFGRALREGWDGEGNPTDAETLQKVKADAREVANDTVLGRR